MPLWMQIYIICYLFILVLNVVFWIKTKGKLLILAFELLAGVFLICLSYAYWDAELMQYFDICSIPAVIMIFLVDIYISVYAKKDDFGIKDEEFSQDEVDFAKMTSVVFASPFYVVSGLASLDILKGFLGL